MADERAGRSFHEGWDRTVNREGRDSLICYCGEEVAVYHKGCLALRDDHAGDAIKSSRYQPCPADGCGELVDTWLAGTTAAHRTPIGVIHGDCYLATKEGN